MKDSDFKIGSAAAIVTVITWASAFIAIKFAIGFYTPFQVTFIRFLTAASIFIPLGLLKRVKIPSAKDIPTLFFLGISGHALYNIFLALGQKQVSPGTASFIVSSSPLWIVVMAHLFRGEKISRKTMLALLTSLFGVGLISFSKGGISIFNPNTLFVLGAALLLASYSVFQKGILKRYTPLEIMVYSSICAFLTLLPFAPSSLEKISFAPIGPTLAAISLGVIPTAVGYLTWSTALKYIPVSRASFFLYLVPFFATLFSWIVFGETPPPLTIAGSLLILFSVVTVNRVK